MARKYRRRKNSRPKVIVKRVPRTLGPTFPSTMIAKHRWTKKFDLTISGSTEDAVSTNSFDAIRPYNLYDPGYGTATTGSAMFYDDLKAHYGMYQVLGSITRVRFVNKCAGPIYAGVFLDHNSLTSGWTMTQIREKGHGKGKQRILGALNSGREVGRFTQGYSLAKWLNIPKKDVGKDRDNFMLEDVTTLNAGFPSSLITFYTALVDKNLQSGDGKVEAYVEIDFTARWSERERLADQSS